MLSDPLDLLVASQLPLAAQSHFDLVSESEPMFFGCRLKASEGANDPMSRSLGSGNGLDEEMVDVGLAVDALGRALDEHGYLYSGRYPHFQSLVLDLIRDYFRLLRKESAETLGNS